MGLPPPLPASNNPFLYDINKNNFNSSNNGASTLRGTNVGNESSTTSKSSANKQNQKVRDDSKTEKDSQSYDLPPSYEEVAGKRPEDKQEKHKSISYKGIPNRRLQGDIKSQGTISSHRELGSNRSLNKVERDEPSKKSSCNRRNHYISGSRRSKVVASSEKDHSNSKKSIVPVNLDTIDKLDLTGVFGGAFHHDGPFDACAPHRNQNKKVAPVLAFPKNSPNSSLVGANKPYIPGDDVFGIDEDHDTYLYHPVTGGKFNRETKNAISVVNPELGVTQFDAKMKADLVHGPTTQGLGSTTFLDGAPAAPVAIEEARNKNTISRKKSLSHRLTRSPPTHYFKQHVNLQLSKTCSRHMASDASGSDSEGFYFGLGDHHDDKKSSTGSKFLRRVKSMNVCRRN